MSKWAELSFEKKLTIFVGPLCVALVTAVLAVALPKVIGDSSGSAIAPSAPATTFAKERLEVLDFFVDGGRRQRLLTDPPTRYPKIDITVRNVGKSVSVLTRAEFRIKDFGKLKICEAGGALQPSRDYDIGLPLAPDPDEVLVHKISQAIEPNSADRFTFTLNVLPRGQWDGEFMYRLAVRLFHDGSDEATPAGTALVSAPHLPEPDYFPPSADLGGPSAFDSHNPNDGSLWGCYLANKQTYRRMLGLEGSRDPRMTPALADWP